MFPLLPIFLAAWVLGGNECWDGKTWHKCMQDQRMPPPNMAITLRFPTDEERIQGVLDEMRVVMDKLQRLLPDKPTKKRR